MSYTFNPALHLRGLGAVTANGDWCGETPNPADINNPGALTWSTPGPPLALASPEAQAGAAAVANPIVQSILNQQAANFQDQIQQLKAGSFSECAKGHSGFLIGGGIGLFALLLLGRRR